MSTFFRLAQPGSPLIPHDNKDVILDAAITHLESCDTKEPAVSLAHVLTTVITIHRVILTLEPQHLAKFGFDASCLDYLEQGFKLPLDAIQIGAILSHYPKDERGVVFEQIINPTHNYQTILSQELLRENANCVANLFDIDRSGALIFEHMRKYNTIHHEVFVNGMEIATIVYWNLVHELAKIIGDNHSWSWLNAPYDPTDLG
mgnify:CR=1 FL=1